ncbi:hypothetical protein ACJD0Z_14735 [Flavobacteriaceae bacterium M23B6Z8]
MLLNISYNEPDVTKKINAEVGKPFTIRERLRFGGVGSPKLHITTSSIDIHNLLVLDNNADTCNIEMRPKGIIVRFRSLLETFALVIPFYKLSLYKGDAAEYSIYRDHYFVKVRADKKVHAFMKKVLNYKSDTAPTNVEDL